MTFQAPQSSGGGSQYGPLLLQLATQQSALANQQIAGIGNTLLRLAEARKEREFVLQRDEAGREFTRERDAYLEANQDEDEQIRRQHALADEARQRAQSLEDTKTIDEFRSKLRKQEVQDEEERRIAFEQQQQLQERQERAARAEVLNMLQGDGVSTYNASYAELLPHYSGIVTSSKDQQEALAKLTAELEGQGLGENSADIARGLLTPKSLPYVDRRQRAAAIAMLSDQGYDNDDAVALVDRVLEGGGYVVGRDGAEAALSSRFSSTRLASALERAGQPLNALPGQAPTSSEPVNALTFFENGFDEKSSGLLPLLHQLGVAPENLKTPDHANYIGAIEVAGGQWYVRDDATDSQRAFWMGSKGLTIGNAYFSRVTPETVGNVAGSAVINSRAAVQGQAGGTPVRGPGSDLVRPPVEPQGLVNEMIIDFRDWIGDGDYKPQR